MNYYQEFEKILNEVSNSNMVPKLLLHACCGPCSSYCLELLTNYFDITILYYNPNIYPDIEYNRRLDELKDLLTKLPHKNSINLVEINYNPLDYYQAIKGLEHLGEKSKRCYECYKLRMEESFKYASLNKYDYCTTTLSISPYKVSNWINEIGIDLEKKYSIKYLYSDFKKKNGYKRSIELSKKYNMYRQDYCGCIYSKLEHDKKIVNDELKCEIGIY